jgi:hypothetical protein
MASCCMDAFYVEGRIISKSLNPRISVPLLNCRTSLYMGYDGPKPIAGRPLQTLSGQPSARYTWACRIWGKILHSNDELWNEICAPTIWSRVLLYRKGDRVLGALSAPPFLFQMEVTNDTDDSDADLSGPFSFEYPTPSSTVADFALAYVNPNRIFNQGQVPTIDFVPHYTVPFIQTRCIRYAAVLGDDAPSLAMDRVKTIHASFGRQMHLVSQGKEEARDGETKIQETTPIEGNRASGQLWKVPTDSNNPMQLVHPEPGLSKASLFLWTTPLMRLISSTPTSHCFYLEP